MERLVPVEALEVVDDTDDPELDEEGLKMSLKVLLVRGEGGWSGPHQVRVL